MFLRRILAASLILYAPFSVSAVEVTDYPELGIFIDEMVERHGFDEEALQTLFDDAEIRDDILDIIARPGEAQPWYKYKTRFLTREHVDRGKKFWARNRKALLEAAEKYRVPPEIIVAIIGIETNYGRTPGRHRVIDALTTLVLKYPKRKKFFRKELENFLLLTREQKLNPLTIKGSYTGAIGLPQFMPSSYRAYAIDLDSNGSADLATSQADAIGSVANYFHIHGWQPGGATITTPRLEGDLYPWLSDLGTQPLFTPKELTRYGIYSRRKGNADQKVSLISFEEEADIEYRLIYHNFYVITRYNNSTKYARAVAELGALIKKAMRRGAG